MRLSDVGVVCIHELARRFGLRVELVGDDYEIPGSYWGESEAGLKGTTLFVRSDTPVHSALHEMSHLVCMSERRRSKLERDAGGTDLEESAVCYLQVLLSDHVPSFSRVRAFDDMDAWGYSFRLGSTRAWFEDDASDAFEWLRERGLIADDGTVRFVARVDGAEDVHARRVDDDEDAS